MENREFELLLSKLKALLKNNDNIEKLCQYFNDIDNEYIRDVKCMHSNDRIEFYISEKDMRGRFYNNDIFTIWHSYRLRSVPVVDIDDFINFVKILYRKHKMKKI